MPHVFVRAWTFVLAGAVSVPIRAETVPLAAGLIFVDGGGVGGVGAAGGGAVGTVVVTGAIATVATENVPTVVMWCRAAIRASRA